MDKSCKSTGYIETLRIALRENHFFARLITFGMVPLFWRVFVGLGLRLHYDTPNLTIFGVIGIWVGVLVGYNLYYRWIFPEKRKA